MAQLVLVSDMQENFLRVDEGGPVVRDAVERLLENVSRYVQDAVGRGDEVAFIEYRPYGHTHPMVREMAPNARILGKYTDSLLHEVPAEPTLQEAAHRHLINIVPNVDGIEVIGINTSDCVLDTALDVRQAFQKDVRIIPGYTLQIPDFLEIEQFGHLNDFTYPLALKTPGIRNRVVEFLPSKYHQGVNFITALKQPDKR